MRCLQFGIWVLHHSMLLHAVISVILCKAYVIGQGHSTASLLATPVRFASFFWGFRFASALRCISFLIFSSLCGLLSLSFFMKSFRYFLVSLFLFPNSPLIFFTFLCSVCSFTVVVMYYFNKVPL